MTPGQHGVTSMSAVMKFNNKLTDKKGVIRAAEASIGDVTYQNK